MSGKGEGPCDPTLAAKSRGKDGAPGYSDGNDFVRRPTSSEQMMVDGSYKVRYRIRHLKQKIEYGGEIGVTPPQ